MLPSLRHVINSSNGLLTLVEIQKEKYWNSGKLTGIGILPEKNSKMLSENTMVIPISQSRLLTRSEIFSRQVLSKKT